MRNYPKTHLPQEPKKSTSQRNRRILVETEEDAFLVEEERTNSSRCPQRLRTENKMINKDKSISSHLFWKILLLNQFIELL